MSADVAEVEVRATREVHYQDVWSVRVTRVFRGRTRVGQTTTVTSGAFRKAPHQVLAWEPIAAGDHLILFLNGPPAGQNNPTTASHDVSGSGVVVVTGGRATEMVQICNPGPYVAAGRSTAAGTFGDDLIHTIDTVRAFRLEFAAHRGDARWLLDQLAHRPEPDARASTDDPIGQDLCRALLATNDADAIARARLLKLPYFESMDLRYWRPKPPATRPARPA